METHSTVSVARIIASGRYDIAPPWQRKPGIHGLKWNRGIIDSCFGVAPADIPATYWQPRDTEDGWIHESVDGKQRITAIIDFIDNKFTWNNKFYAHENKLSLTKEEKKMFDIFAVTFKISNRTLTQPEISLSFAKFQLTKKTSLGEKLHSVRGVLTGRIEAMLLEHKESGIWADDVFKSTLAQKRFQPLEKYVRCFYLFCKNRDAGTTKSVTNFWGEQLQPGYTIPAESEFAAFGTRMTEVFSLFAANKDIRSKSSKIRSLFRLMCWSCQPQQQKHHQGHIDYLKENLTEIVKMDGFANINGNHNAAVVRLKFLKHQVHVVWRRGRGTAQREALL